MPNRDEYTTTRNLTAAEELNYSRQGRTLINQLSILLKTAKLYRPDNKIFKTQIEQFYRLLVTAFEEVGELSLQIRSGHPFFCGVRIKYDMQGFASSKHLTELFHKIDISGFIFSLGTTLEELENTIVILNAVDGEGIRDFAAIQQRFTAARVDSIAPLPPATEKRGAIDEEKEKRSFAKRTYFYAINNLKTVTEAASAGKQVDLNRITRVIHSLVDQILEDDSDLLELTALKSHDHYTHLHCVNVCIYSLCLGVRINLSKSELSVLGFSALFHDIGKARLPLEILNKPADFSHEDWELMRKHPIYGVLAIARSMPFDERSSRAIIVAFEHHYNLDGSGYPQLPSRRALNLYTKIVTICDVFDAMTSGRVYRKNPVSPEYVLRNMIKQAGYKFDHNLLKVFLNTVSPHPPGTLLLLDNNQYALVLGKNDVDLLRPRVKLIGDAGRLFDKGIRASLTDRNQATGDYLRSITRVVNPQELPSDTTRFILE